jgi:hypothetical protein
MDTTQPEKPTGQTHWIICSLLITFLSIVWSERLHWVNWNRKGQQNVFWQLTDGPQPPPLLPKELFLTIPAILFLQLFASAVVVWRARQNRIILALVLLAIWLISAVFSIPNFSYGPFA